jgi:hypothetical protein
MMESEGASKTIPKMTGFVGQWERNNRQNNLDFISKLQKGSVWEAM